MRALWALVDEVKSADKSCSRICALHLIITDVLGKMAKTRLPLAIISESQSDASVNAVNSIWFGCDCGGSSFNTKSKEVWLTYYRVVSAGD